MNKIEFINSTNIAESLTEAVINQFGGWNDFIVSAQDVANHGIDGGFRGFIYHAETVKFAHDNLKAIISLCKQWAEDFGKDGAYSFIADFNCLPDYSADEIAEAIHTHSIDDASWDDDYVQVMNALAWFAGEEICRAYADLMERAA